MATRAVEKGMPIEQVQKILGHEQIDTTLRYAMVNQRSLYGKFTLSVLENRLNLS